MLYVLNLLYFEGYVTMVPNQNKYEMNTVPTPAAAWTTA